MQLIDSHAHIYLNEFNSDLDEMVNRAKKVNVYKILLPNIDRDSLPEINKLCSAYPDYFYPMIGLHPTSVKENFEEEMQQLFEDIDFNKYVAIGEIGMDLYWDKSFKKEQEIAFEHQIELAKEHDLPIVIHTRDAFDEIFSLIDKLNDDKLKGIFHCFTGSVKEAKKIIEYGNFKLGIGGIVTFKNGGLDKVLKYIDPHHLVLETDAPYLAPVPYRGKRNESAYLEIVAEKLCDIYDMSIKEISNITTNNCKKIFSV